MSSVSSDTVAWLAQELSLTCLEDGPDGSVRVLAGLAPAGARELAETAARVAGLSGEDPKVAAIVDRARAGGRATLDVPGPIPGRLVAWNIGAERARVLFAPEPDAVRKRAATADAAASVTHELANALTAITGWTRMAASGPLPERARHALDMVQRSARDALGAARGLLATMRESARETIPPNARDRTNVSLVVAEVIETMRPELDEAGVDVEMELDPDVFGTTPASSLRLIVGNLVRNARDAVAPNGLVHVAVRGHGDRVQVTVADDGPGMSAETLAHAFDRYFTTKANGTGLGLALVQSSVREAGGRVEVESRRGAGTRFDVWLPAAGATHRSVRPREGVTARSGVHPKPVLVDTPVLVVDDDEGMRALVRTALELLGAQVHTAADVDEALAVEGRFAIALVDLSLGEGRGDALLARLRAEGRVERAILLTGSADAELHPLGAPDVVLRKPFELEDLTRAVGSLLDVTALEAEA